MTKDDKENARENIANAIRDCKRNLDGAPILYVATEYTRSCNRRCRVFTINDATGYPTWLMWSIATVMGRRLWRKDSRDAVVMTGGGYSASHELADDVCHILNMKRGSVHVEEV